MSAAPLAPEGGGLPLARLVAVLGTPVSPEQGEVVTAPLEAGVVVAGAGSGKTATMVARVAWLVGSGLVAPEQVLGLTFTTKAADELAGRLRAALRALRAAGLVPPPAAGAEGDGEPVVSTYHAYAGRLVRDHALRLGREPGARLITPATSWQLAARAVATYDGPMDAVGWAESTVVRAVLSLAGDLAEHLVEPADVAAVTATLQALADAAPRLLAPAKQALASQRTRVQLLPLVQRYTDAKRARDLLDFGDVVALAARLARSCPDVAAAERAAARVVLLDEYQDTGAAQEVLLSSLFGPLSGAEHPVTAVGDPCQSIYGWRGASAGTLRRFPAAFGARRTTPRTLRTTYRNGGRVLLLANRVSAPLRAQGLPVPRLEPAPGRAGDGTVRCALLPDVAAEAGWVADGVVRALQELPVRPGQGRWSRAAVLCRKRSMFPRLRAALEARGVPVEVVGLGGLLDVPEVADLVAVLRVLDDPTADAALLRLLTGPRWRVGPRDLAVLGRRARRLVRDVVRPAEGVDPVQAVVLGVDDAAAGSLVDALDDLPPEDGPDPLSVEGRRRLVALRDELRSLRRRADQPLPDLVADVERTTGLDVEVAVRGRGRADLDAFSDAVAAFAGDAAQDGAQAALTAFLAFLDAAREEEDGLDAADRAQLTGNDAVQLMTVHAAKGLEWPVVAVPGLARGTGGGAAVFPAKPATSTSWTENPRLLPFPLRGDRSDLPVLAGLDKESLAAHEEAVDARNALEERRLAYVAVTRAESVLLVSGYHWGEGKRPLGPSVFLQEAREACGEGAGEVEVWQEEPPEENPLTAQPVTAPWPRHGPVAPVGTQEAAARVRVLLADGLPGAGPVGSAGAGLDAGLALSPAAAARVAAWDEDLRRLADEARRRRARTGEALLPQALSVSRLVELRRDPEGLARALQRPVPQRPSRTARQGTAFHAWLESAVFGQPQLLGPDELPGAADDAAPDAGLAALQEAFRASAWWGRTPVAVEVPFETVVEGVLLRGRMDAVYAEPDGGYVVVDWKTGPPRRGSDADAAVVQLAAYRLAWATLAGVAPERVGAAFHHVREGLTVRPVDLPDAAGLVALLRAVPVAQG